VGIGLTGAIAFARLLRDRLFETPPLDPIAFTAVTVLLCAVAALAVFVPARRSTRIDPIVTLRGV
jgi:hypothetical protein